MHDSQRYRDSAVKCLLAAQEACQPYYRKLHLSMADSWLSLARRDEAMDNLLGNWDTAKADPPNLRLARCALHGRSASPAVIVTRFMDTSVACSTS
jgi:hypothetical protein